jgi:hypothetical protein
MKHPSPWIAWLVIIVLVVFDGYLKFHRDAGFWVYGPAVLVSLGVGYFLFGDEDNSEPGSRQPGSRQPGEPSTGEPRSGKARRVGTPEAEEPGLRRHTQNVTGPDPVY